MITGILYLILILLGIPAGILLYKMCKEEITKWEKRLVIMIVVAVIAIIILLFIDLEIRVPVIASLGFIIVTNISIIVKNKLKTKIPI